jgi:peroxiredoxin (alkyl hydroperoxide reductase subunit C)
LHTDVQILKPVPDFACSAYVRSEDEQQISLSQFDGKWVVLFFYPRDFTFVCPTEIQEFARHQEQFAKERAVVLGASTDSFYAHKAWFESDPRLADVNFPVLADTTQALARQFGCLLDDGRALRATYIIDPDRILRHLQMNDPDVGRNVEEVLRLLRAFRTGDLCPATWKPGERTLTKQLREKAA